MRIIIYTGKGGVGKTSIAAAAALRMAALGHRTIIMSTDAAHSLGDAFDQELGHDPILVAPNLWAMEINAYKDLEQNWGAVRTHIARIVALQGMDNVLADEAAILPGMEEMFSLARIKDLSESKLYDVIVVDAAPTGDTLRLLSLPQTLAWSVKLLRRADTYIIKPLIRPLARLSPAIEEMIAPEEVFEALEKMLKKLQAIKKLLADSGKTTIRMVMNPEKMVIKESKRALTYLNMYGLLVDSVIVNRVLGENSGYLDGWRTIQQRYLEEIYRDFAPLPIQIAPQYAGEVVGTEGLTRLAADVYGSNDPSNILFQHAIFEITKQQQEYLLKMRMPMLDRSRLRIRTTGTELVLQVENQRRIISLPSAMTGYRPARANYQEEYLLVHFTKPSNNSSLVEEETIPEPSALGEETTAKEV